MPSEDVEIDKNHTKSDHNKAEAIKIISTIPENKNKVKI